ncbi:MAG TPA: hypothetical protein VME69_00230 [Methylocella sp.]|nr:hypothetical protein [Methylocella sp.]
MRHSLPIFVQRPLESLAFCLAVLTLNLACLASPLAARPVVPAEQRYLPYDGDLPACNDASVLDRIEDRFDDRESEFWNSGLLIVGFDHIREIGYRTNGADYIPRRFCTARAYLNDSTLHSVSYSIGEDLGFLGFGFGVTWCVDGLDRNYAYAPHCKMARP